MVNETILELKKKIEWIEGLHKEGDESVKEPQIIQYIDFIAINSTESLKTELIAFERLLLLLRKQ